MRRFRFRAAAVLDLRRRQEEAASRALSLAQAAQQAAQAREARAAGDHDAARETLIAEQRDGTSSWRIGWHQSWITRQQRDVEISRAAVRESAGAVARASAALNEARQRVRVIERLHDRALSRYRADAERAELQAMNDAATVRFAARMRGLGGSNGDDRSDDGDTTNDGDRRKGG